MYLALFGSSLTTRQDLFLQTSTSSEFSWSLLDMLGNDLEYTAPQTKKYSTKPPDVEVKLGSKMVKLKEPPKKLQNWPIESIISSLVLASNLYLTFWQQKPRAGTCISNTHRLLNTLEWFWKLLKIMFCTFKPFY